MIVSLMYQQFHCNNQVTEQRRYRDEILA